MIVVVCGLKVILVLALVPKNRIWALDLVWDQAEQEDSVSCNGQVQRAKMTQRKQNKLNYYVKIQ